MVDRVVSLVERQSNRVELAVQERFVPSEESLRVMRDFMAESEAGTAQSPQPMNGAPINIAQRDSKVGPVLNGLIELDRLVSTVWHAASDLVDQLAPISSHHPQPSPVPEYPRITVEEGSPEALKHIAAIHAQLINVLDRVVIAKQDLAI